MLWLALPKQADRFPAVLGSVDEEFSAEYIGGFGPGGNEIAFAVYKIPADAAAKVGNCLPSCLNGVERDGEDFFYDWHETPISSEDADQTQYTELVASEEMKHKFATEYLENHMFRNKIAVPQKYLDQADAALQRPGNSFAFGRASSLAIVDVQRRFLYVMYTG
ncbi:MAG: hypothetical protein WA979_09955 [Pacificimonas sp.]